ncbi:MAG: type II toxin-antitoxin system PrlF family antitoxin [Alphaproteobacteria bacterium]|nr:type II toxin-antitoxin system PrlF family antitoxin [Alphaproteobacteria bacterium]
MTELAFKTERIEIRVTAEEKSLLQSAAQKAHLKLSQYMLLASIAATEGRLQNRLILNDAEWERFQALLNQPAQENAGLQKLFKQFISLNYNQVKTNHVAKVPLSFSANASHKSLDSEDALAEPALLAFLDFIDDDIAANAGNISEMPANILQRAQELTKGMDINLNDELHEDLESYVAPQRTKPTP